MRSVLDKNQQAQQQPQSYTTGSSSRSVLPETIVLATSLTRGRDPKLNALGTNATCYTNPGAKIADICSRIPHILRSDNLPRCVVLQCGGNDVDNQSSYEVTREYDCLIGDIQQRCPRASIILIKIPPRRHNKDVLNKISPVNTYLQHRVSEGDGVNTIDVCPHDPAMFRKNLVHFNVKGSRIFAKQMYTELLIFFRFSSQTFM